MRFSWHHLALLGAAPGAIVIVAANAPRQFTYDALMNYLLDVISEERIFFCYHCVRPCIQAARGESFLQDDWPETFPRAAEHRCAEVCSDELQEVIAHELRLQVTVILPQELKESLRELPVEEQSQARSQASDAMQRAAADVGNDHRYRKCKHEDGGMSPLDPNSPGDRAAAAAAAAALTKQGSARHRGEEEEKNNIVPFKKKQRGPGLPPLARDAWATEEPYHVPLQIDRICVSGQRAQGFNPAVAERRCRYKPFPRQQPQPLVPPLAIPVPGTAPGLEPGTPGVNPGLGAAAGRALLLKGL
ncbi:MAG: hypothetical protein M1826_003443 [Phylliscum demangeonii]|nr:MAG: hypothetical protein M1826_003443 [Phylliscum demangeonii]